MLGARTSIERPLFHLPGSPRQGRQAILRQVDSQLDIPYHAGDIPIEGFSAF